MSSPPKVCSTLRLLLCSTQRRAYAYSSSAISYVLRFCGWRHDVCIRWQINKISLNAHNDQPKPNIEAQEEGAKLLRTLEGLLEIWVLILEVMAEDVGAGVHHTCTG